MAPAPLRVDDGRHPWIAEFERSPKAAFGDLLAGYARIHPYERADAPDAARMLFGPLGADDPAWRALGPTIVGWLKERRREPLPANPHRLQRHVREVCEAFEIVALLSVADAAVELRRGFITWNEWVARQVLSASRDARAEYWRMLALTQPLVADTSAIAPHGLATFWLQVCAESGGRLPDRYLTIGLLGLRRLPGAPLDGTETPWLAGLARWALAQRPSEEAFLAEWRPLKQLYPRTPTRWRKAVGDVLAAKLFKDAGVEPPAWWAADPDFPPMRDGVGSTYASPPPKEPRDQLLGSIRQQQALVALRPRIERIVSEHRRYAERASDPYYLVRTFTNIGMRLIRRGNDARDERAQVARALAQEVLQWKPRHRFAWALWQNALAEEGALEAAELVGWERVRRLPEDPHSRTELGDFLARQTDRRGEAEALYRETIQQFPDNVHARTQLAELLIAQDRLAEAEAIAVAAVRDGAFNAVTYAIQARLRSHAGDVEGAQRALAAGLRVERQNAVLRAFLSQLNAGRKLPLVSRAFVAGDGTAAQRSADEPSVDPFLAAAVAQGRARRLRFQLDRANDELRAEARAEVERWLKEDRTFAYAELLAARQRIWAAEATTLPPVAVAFEAALAAEDQARLEALASRMPRLEALILVACAVLGDPQAAEQVERWLRTEPELAEEPAVAALRTLMRPVLRVIEGGKSAAEAIVEMCATVIDALHDANEATLGDALLAA